MAVIYTSGNRTSSSTLHTSEDMSKGYRERNKTGNTYGSKQQAQGSHNLTQLQHEDPSLSAESRNPSVPHVSAGGKVSESTPSADDKKDQEDSQRKDILVPQDNSNAIKAKRGIGDLQPTELLPAYVKALEKGPII